MTGRVQDRVIVVTGAASGQGAAEVSALLDEGAVVVATDVQGFTVRRRTAFTAAGSMSPRPRTGGRLPTGSAPRSVVSTA